MDAYDTSDFFFPFTKQGFRATLFLLFGGAGFTLLLIAVIKARRINARTRAVVSLISCAAIVAMAFFVRWESQGDPSPRFGRLGEVPCRGVQRDARVGLFVLVWAVLGLLFEERRSSTLAPIASDAASSGGRFLATVGMVTKLLFVTAAEIDAGAAPAKFSMRTMWFVGFTRSWRGCSAATKFGSWTFAVGGNKEASRQVGVPRRAPRPSCSCWSRERRGWWACCSPSASTRSRPTPETVRSSTTSSPPSSAGRCSPAATGPPSVARSVR